MIAIALLCVLVCSVNGNSNFATVMSFNVRTSEANDRDRCGAWAQRKHRAVQHMEEYSPDFIGTQETSDLQKADFDAALAHTYASVGRSAVGGNSPEINAIYYKKRDWKVLEHNTFWLSDMPEVPSNTWGMSYFRTCVFARFEHVQTGKVMCMFNTHYAMPGNDMAQKRSSHLISHRMRSVCQEYDSFAVLTGDLNSTPNTPAIRYLTGKNHGGISPLPLKISSDKGTWCADCQTGTCSSTKFDYVLYAKGALTKGGCHTETQVLRQSYDGCYVSDHATLLSSFCISGNCCGQQVPSDSSSDDEHVPTPRNEKSKSQQPIDAIDSGHSGTNQNSSQAIVPTGTAHHNELNAADQNEIQKSSTSKQGWVKQAPSLFIAMGVCISIIGSLLFVAHFYRKHSLRSHIHRIETIHERRCTLDTSDVQFQDGMAIL